MCKTFLKNESQKVKKKDNKSDFQDMLHTAPANLRLSSLYVQCFLLGLQLRNVWANFQHHQTQIREIMANLMQNEEGALNCSFIV